LAIPLALKVLPSCCVGLPPSLPRGFAPLAPQ
jgi:hypothetical protein